MHNIISATFVFLLGTAALSNKQKPLIKGILFVGTAIATYLAVDKLFMSPLHKETMENKNALQVRKK